MCSSCNCWESPAFAGRGYVSFWHSFMNQLCVFLRIFVHDMWWNLSHGAPVGQKRFDSCHYSYVRFLIDSEHMFNVLPSRVSVEFASSRGSRPKYISDKVSLRKLCVSFSFHVWHMFWDCVLQPPAVMGRGQNLFLKNVSEEILYMFIRSAFDMCV